MPHHNVYVVELSEDVWNHRPFRERNPERRDDKPCLYVGLTGKTPAVRFAQHKAGIRAAKYVKRYGIRLRPRMYERHNPKPYKEAVEFEKELARRLRKRGLECGRRNQVAATTTAQSTGASVTDAAGIP